MKMMDIFHQILADARLTSHHVSLYFALLVKAWQEGQPLAIKRHEIMQQAKIRSRKTYTRCLYELQDWNYLRYYPANNQFQSSEITLAMSTNEHSTQNAVQINDPSNPPAMPTNEHNARNAVQINGHSNPPAMPINDPSIFFAMPKSEHSNLSAMLTNDPSNLSAMPINDPSELDKYAENQGNSFAMPKTEHSKAAAPPPPSSSTSMKYKNKFINDVVVGGADVGAPRPRSKNLPTDHPFTQSPYFDWTTFQAAFANANHYQNVDLHYYYDALCDWRDRTSGLPPLRSDWLRTARVFMRNDDKQQKLAIKQPAPQANKPVAKSPLIKIITNEKYGFPTQ